MMLLSLLLLAAAPSPGGCLDPDDSTPLGQDQLARGVECKKRVPFPPGYFRTPGPLPLPKQVAIKKYFDTKFFDGTSIRWKWPDQQKDRSTYCGWVNAKNRMGAYTGWRPYYVTFSKAGTVDHDEVKQGDGSHVLLDIICKDQGYNIDTPPVD